MKIDLKELQTAVSGLYSDVARYPRGDFHFPIGRPVMERLGYPPERLDQIPKTALESYAGVGYYFDLDPLKAGERVLDLGCGSGSDLLYAALEVGPTGHVTGLDMTPAMLDKSRKNAERGEFSWVTVEEGYIEKMPFEAESFDCVISNGVINLTPDKRSVFEGIARVLVPGGRLMFCDIVTGVELPESVRENCALWAECIGGALEKSQYLKLIEEAGLRIDKVRPNPYQFSQGSTLDAARKFQVTSISILAVKD